MNLNCKPGDLAVRVKSHPTCFIKVGAILEVIELSDASFVLRADGNYYSKNAPLWIVKYRGSEIDPSDGFCWGVHDSDLRPIRDNDGNDETLTWRDVPSKVTV